MHILTRLNLEDNEVDIVDVEDRQSNDEGVINDEYLNTYDSFIDDLDNLKREYEDKDDYELDVMFVTKSRIEIWEKYQGWTGKTKRLLYVYSIIRYDEDL